MSVSSRSQPAAPPPAPDRTAHLLDVRCPRCGYALRGEIKTWTDHCPVDGRCTECGLRFAWVDVFTPDLFGPRWCVEFAPRRRLAASVVSTWARSLWPWPFFRALRMTHEIKPGRLLVFVAGLIALAYLVVCIGQARFAYAKWAQQTQTGPGWQMGTSVSAPRAVLQAFATPFSNRPPGSTWQRFLGRRSVYPHPSPAKTLGYWAGLALLAPAGVLMAVLQPVGFLAMPISVRRARVRPGHLARVTAYSLSWLLLVAVLHGLFAVVLGERALNLPTLMWLHLLFIIGFALTWHGAVRFYLRMQHALAVSIAVTVMAGLLTMLIIVQFYWIMQPAYL